MRTVLKIGGSILEPAPLPALLHALIERACSGDRLVIVHGGGKSLTAMLAQLGVTTQFVGGLRITDEATLDAALMVLAGSVNKRLVAALNAAAVALDDPYNAGFKAVGLCGIDGDCVVASVTDPELGLVGEVTGGNPSLLNSLLAAGFTPVLASIAACRSDHSQTAQSRARALNVNADQFASAVAQLVAADRLVIVTDVAGVLDATGERIATVTINELEHLATSGAISGGMLPKLAACREALLGGVSEVEIVGPDALLGLSSWDSGTCPGTRVLPALAEVAAG
jgi:acetylglutamate kinase